ncbi:MAG: RimJ/RimL family protein N-acetyltransferase [bacterium]|jgi:RimJ/RimL family protein N-acetyltransferase
MIQIGFEKYQLQEIHISVFSQNVPALLLYSRLGFVPYQVEERKNLQPHRLALIHLKLKHHQWLQSKKDKL